MPSILRSDRLIPYLALLLSGGLLFLSGTGSKTYPVFAAEPSPATQYSTLELPVGNFGFRGISRDRYGSLYVASSLRNGVYVLPPGCRNESCATLIPLEPSLGLPGEVVADPRRGGAYVLLRLGDRIDYLPPHCLSDSCLKSILLPERPAYPFRAVYNARRHALAVLDRLSGRIILVEEGCRSAHCLSFIHFPDYGQPSGIAYDQNRGDLWVTFSRSGNLLKIPSNCRKISCSVLFPSTIPDLFPDSPVISGSDRLFLILKKGSAIGWVDLGQTKQTLRMQSIEPTSGRILALAPLRTGEVYLATGGEYPHAGSFGVGPSCPDGCFDLRLLPFKNGRPYGLSSGIDGTLWMTIDDRDSLYRISSRAGCGERKNFAPVLKKECLREIVFQNIETLYHSRYHQEIQVPSEPSTKLSDPSD